MSDSSPGDVLAFWFGPERGVARPEWFRKSEAFDAHIRERFGALHAQAATGGLADWEVAPDSALALLLVLDQFSRNLHRDDPRAFAQDARALRVAKSVLQAGWDCVRLPVERQFLYLPFEHAENLAEQDRSVGLFATLEAFAATKGLTEWAEKHRVIIRRFGRFPHRNAVLGRSSTVEELAFLRGPDSSF